MAQVQQEAEESRKTERDRLVNYAASRVANYFTNWMLQSKALQTRANRTSLILEALQPQLVLLARKEGGIWMAVNHAFLVLYPAVYTALFVVRRREMQHATRHRHNLNRWAWIDRSPFGKLQRWWLQPEHDGFAISMILISTALSVTYRWWNAGEVQDNAQ
jgi:hypothetical protein